MKKTNQENYFEGVTATAYFVGLLYRMIKDGEIFKSQTSYLPPNELWWLKGFRNLILGSLNIFKTF